MKELYYYSKNDKDTYAFFYDKENNYAWAVHMPRVPSGTSDMGREVGGLEGIKNEDEARDKLKKMVDNL